MKEQRPVVQEMILEYLRGRGASYRRPVPSRELSAALGICWSYARAQARALVTAGEVAVRNGPGGGYYLNGPTGSAWPGGAGPGEPSSLVRDLQALVAELHAASSELSALAEAIAAGWVPGHAARPALTPVSAPGSAQASDGTRLVEALRRLRKAVGALG